MAFMSLSCNFFDKMEFDLYARGINITKRYIEARTIDKIECFAGCFFALSLWGPLSILGCLLPPIAKRVFETAIVSSVFFITIHSNKLYYKHIKIPYIEKEFQNTIKTSQSNQKSALIWRELISNSNNNFSEFSQHHHLLNTKKLAENYSLKVLTNFSEDELAHNRDFEYKKFDRIILNAHGDKNHICVEPILTRYSNKELKWLNAHIEDGGIIVLESCCTGEGRDNIAREISFACPKATVYAPSGPIQASEIEYDNNLVPSFKSENILALLSFGWFGETHDITRLYQNGRLLRDRDQ